MSRKKHGIRAPRRPRGESVKVTIGNQEKQIKVLIDRCEELRKQADESYVNGKAWMDQAKAQDAEFKNLKNMARDIANKNNYYEGYIARVKEEDQRREYPTFPPTAMASGF